MLNVCCICKERKTVCCDEGEGVVTCVDCCPNHPDVTVEKHGINISLFVLETDPAREWVKNHAPEATTWADGIVVDAHSAHALAKGMTGDGLKVV